MRVRAAGAFVLGAVCSAGILAAGLGATFWFFPTALPLRDAPQRSAEERPRPGPAIANWPEIRNGVPDVIGPTSRGAAATAAVPSIAPPPAVVAPVEIQPVAAAPLPAPIRPAIAVAEPPPVPDPMLALRPSEPPPVRRESDEEAPALRTATAEAAASDAPAQAGVGDEQAVPAVAPLPPRRPILAEPASRRPVPPRQRAAAAPPAAAPAPAEPPPPQEPPRPSILGLPLPDIIPSGQRVKECLLELKC